MEAEPHLFIHELLVALSPFITKVSLESCLLGLRYDVSEVIQCYDINPQVICSMYDCSMEAVE